MNGEKLNQSAQDYQHKSKLNAQHFNKNRFRSPRAKSSTDSQPTFLQKHWVGFAIISAACLLTAGFVYFMLNRIDFNTQTDTDLTLRKKPQPPKFYTQLSHQEVSDQVATTKPITAIMIGNSPDARPQSGLKDAELVFEAIAEGGITRFLCLYQTNKPQLIGPVRSLREYYVDWLTPFNASVAHVGGSREALNIVRNGRYRDIDQFFNGQFYWRASDRYAPHNVYTSFAKLDTLNAQRGYLNSEITMFKRQIFKSPAQLTQSKTTPQLPAAQNINFKISGPLYNVAYRYDPTTNQYRRQVGGRDHLDREKGQIAPNAVIAISTDMQHILEDGYRERITTIGQDKAYIFQNGQVIEGTWKKADRQQQIHFYDNQQQEIAINSGQVWISVIPKTSGKVTWQ